MDLHGLGQHDTENETRVVNVATLAILMQWVHFEGGAEYEIYKTRFFESDGDFSCHVGIDCFLVMWNKLRGISF